jgi:ParD-like antitoxin of type II bacterial toxin-antitoxin system
MKSIRVADRIYELAQQEAAVMSRSIAQQVEHWAQIGAALEAAGVTLDQLRSVLGGDLRARERIFMKLGWANQESMYLVPPAVARTAKLTMPDPSALDAR